MDNKEFIPMAQALMMRELMKIEEQEVIKKHWEENTRRRWNTNYWSHTFDEDGVTYRHPKEEEFIIGFKFESRHWFTNKGLKDWEEAEITEENRQDFLELYNADAYPSEFRVKC